MIMLDIILIRLIRAAKILSEKGYVSGKGGNISARYKGKYIIIKKTGSRMNDLKPKDFILINLEKRSHPLVSSDYFIHRFIYLKSQDTNFVIHVHPCYTVVYSFFKDKLEPLTYDSKVILKKPVPIYSVEKHSKLPDIVSPEDLKRGIIIEKGHGIYVFSNSLEEIINLIEIIEETARNSFLKLLR